MKPDTTYKEISEKIKNMFLYAAKGEMVYETPEITEALITEFNCFVDKLYHRGMQKLKVDIPTYSGYIMKKGDWIFVEQDESGVWFWDETRAYCAELDYDNALPPEDMFECN